MEDDGKVNIMTTALDQSYLGPAGFQFSICKIYVTLSAAASWEFCGKKDLLRISVTPDQRVSSLSSMACV